MDACKPNTEKSHAISRASSSASVDSRAASEGGVESTSHSIQLSTGSFGNNLSLLDNAVVRLRTSDPTLPRNLQEPLRHWGNVVSLLVVANSETLVLPAIILTCLRIILLQEVGGSSSSADATSITTPPERRAEIMITKLEELVIAARALPLPSFGIATSNSADKETPGGPPMNEVKTVAKYNTRKLKIGKQVTETSIVVAKKNPSSRR